ncbi:MAG: hypothetical protein AAF329_12085 [Cyanobacteria bacterium P01_A01_bin.17]
MQAIETTATINESGQLTLDYALGFTKPQRVRLIILIDEADEADPDETPTEEAIEGIRQELQEALSGQTLPLSAMWEGIDVR